MPYKKNYSLASLWDTFIKKNILETIKKNFRNYKKFFICLDRFGTLSLKKFFSQL